jgi:hypothetical protein
MGARHDPGRDVLLDDLDVVHAIGAGFFLVGVDFKVYFARCATQLGLVVVRIRAPDVDIVRQPPGLAK